MDNKIVVATNKKIDVMSIEILENKYETKKYQVKFNKYILGIFKTKFIALKFIERWIKKHSSLSFSPVAAG